VRFALYRVAELPSKELHEGGYMLAQLGKVVGYTKAPKATYVALHPVKGFRTWRNSRRGINRMAAVGLGAAVLALPAGIWALRRNRNSEHQEIH
jgi:hypothetical protein